MAHGDIHAAPKGGEESVELIVRVVDVERVICGIGWIDQITFTLPAEDNVREYTVPDTIDVDYLDYPEKGVGNILYLPLGLAEEAGIGGLR